MKHAIRSALVITMIASCAGSGGTETGNPALAGFTSSACKSRPPDSGQQALVRADDAEGLQCVEWVRGQGNQLTLRLLNFPEPCGDAYDGAAHVSERGVLELSLFKADCSVYRCGTCVFDFEAELHDVPGQAPLELRTGSAICASEPTNWDDSLILPIDTKDSGVVCRLLERSAVEQYGRARGSCGQRNMPCGDCAGLDAQSCAAGLSCTMVAPGDSRCLEQCTSDADCQGGLSSCRDGSCRAELSW